MLELDIPYTIKLINSGKHLIKEAQEGRIDMLISISEQVERLEYFDYPQESYKQITWNFFDLKDLIF